MKKGSILYALRIPLIALFLYLCMSLAIGLQSTRNHETMLAISCISNMKQLGLALDQYAQDSDNVLPQAAAADCHGWREATYPYVKFTSVYRCPSDTRSGSQDSPNNLPESYTANTVSLGKTDSSDLARTITVMDTRGFGGEDWDITSAAFLPSTGRRLYAHFPSHMFYERPRGTLNLLFADGHVKRLPPMDTLTPTNLWTRDNAPFAGQNLANAQAILTHAEKE